VFSNSVSGHAGLAEALPVNDRFGDANVRADVISMFTSLALPDLRRECASQPGFGRCLA
jgi:hypothetical protein